MMPKPEEADEFEKIYIGTKRTGVCRAPDDTSQRVFTGTIPRA